MSKVELLAPVGDWDCLKAAVQNGADAVYFGVEQFNARMYAKNFNIDDMKQVINYCKLRNRYLDNFANYKSPWQKDQKKTPKTKRYILNYSTAKRQNSKKRKKKKRRGSKLW